MSTEEPTHLYGSATTPPLSASDRRMSTEDLYARKGGVPIVCLTAYTTPMAQYLDHHSDLLLVGDSLAMVIYGLDTTVGITIETMIAHGQAVMRGSTKACVMVDMPFGTYEDSWQQALGSARRIIDETGAQAVKMEGGVNIAGSIQRIVEDGIPVCGHVGLLPQKVTKAGGFKIQGRDDEGAKQILADAVAVSDAGAFNMVVEGTVEPLARLITETVRVPTIGIGASAACDGQVLVTQDMLGLFSDFTPKFVKRYAEVGIAIEKAVSSFAEEVRARRFPEPQHTFPEKK